MHRPRPHSVARPLALGLVIATTALTQAAGANAAAPSNDNFADAQEPNTGDTNPTHGTNVDATKEVGEPDHAGDVGGASVWYRWTATVTGDATVDTCDSNFDTTLGVYTGDSVGGLTEVTADDNGCILGFGSFVDFQAQAGTVYRIAVDGLDAEMGEFDIYVVPPAAPPPKRCADGQDNDGDGKIDMADPGCSSPDDDDEADPPALPPPTDPGSPRLGTTGDDNISGTAGADVICGLGGSDVINGLGGNDSLFGDACPGVAASRRAAAAAGADDQLNGGSGNDRLKGGPGSDRLAGNAGADSLDGGPGRDVLNGGGGRDRIVGGADADRVNVKDGKRDRVDCGGGRDRIQADRKDRARNCERRG